jgi:hypothetical protein
LLKHRNFFPLTNHGRIIIDEDALSISNRLHFCAKFVTIVKLLDWLLIELALNGMTLNTSENSKAMFSFISFIGKARLKVGQKIFLHSLKGLRSLLDINLFFECGLCGF